MLYNIYTIGDKTQTVLASIEANDSFAAYDQLAVNLKVQYGFIADKSLWIAFPVELVPTEA